MSLTTQGKMCRLFGDALRKKFLLRELKRNMKVNTSIVQRLYQLVGLLIVTLKKVVASMVLWVFFNGYEQ